MIKKNILMIVFLNSFCLMKVWCSQALWSKIKATHEAIQAIDDDFKKGKYSLDKAERKKYPLWKSLAEDYSSLNSTSYYSSKSSVGLQIPGNFTELSLVMPGASDFKLAKSDVGLIQAALKTGNILDVRLFYDFSKKIVMLTVIDLATNATILSQIVPTTLSVAPSKWYLIAFLPNSKKQLASGWQVLNNSIYLQMS